MNYFIWLKRRGEPVLFEDYFLPGIIPDRTVDLMAVDQVPKKLGMCEECELNSSCHVMQDVGDGIYRHLCPMLFVDVFNPPWRLSELT